ALPHRTELQADHAGADDAEALRHYVEFPRLPGIDDPVAVEWRGLELDRLRTGGAHGVLRLQNSRPGRSVEVGHLSPAVLQQVAEAANAVDAVALEQLRDAAGELLDDGGAARLHGREVQLHLAELRGGRGKLVLRLVDH